MSLLQGESWREDSQEPGAWVWPGLQPGKNRRFQASENPRPCSALDTPEPATCWSRADPEMVLTQRLLPVILLTLFWGPSKAGAQGELRGFLPLPSPSSQGVLKQVHAHMSPRKPLDPSLPASLSPFLILSGTSLPLLDPHSSPAS